jgi:threonine/homoserine/homoserine lactone efflux protein
MATRPAGFSPSFPSPHVAVPSPVQTVAFGAVFGFALAAPPGPMNAIIAEESVLRGWLSGFTAGLGAMTADVCFFVLSLLGVVTIVGELPTLRAVMIAVGGVLMLYFAYDAVADAQDTFTADSGKPAATGGTDSGDGDSTDDQRAASDGGEGTRAKGFRKAFILALTNPYQIVFWLTVGVGLLQPGTVAVFEHVSFVGEAYADLIVVQTGSPALLVGFFAGIVVWIVGFPATLVSVGRRIDAFAPAVAALSALVLAGFGVTFIWRATTLLL